MSIMRAASRFRLLHGIATVALCLSASAASSSCLAQTDSVVPKIGQGTSEKRVAPRVTPAMAPNPDIDLSSVGPAIGEKLPDFRLSDQHGIIRTLDSAAGPKGTMVVFFRSAEW